MLQFKKLKYIKYEEVKVIDFIINKYITKEEKTEEDFLPDHITAMINDKIRSGVIKNILAFKGVIRL